MHHQAYVAEEADELSFISATDNTGSMSVASPPAMTEHGSVSARMNLTDTFSQLADYSGQQAQIWSQHPAFNTNLSVIQEEISSPPQTAFLSAAPDFLHGHGQTSALRGAGTGQRAATPTLMTDFYVVNPTPSFHPSHDINPNPNANLYSVPDGISDIQHISPISATQEEETPARTQTQHLHQQPQPQPQQVRTPRFGNTYYRGVGQKQYALHPRDDDLAEDQKDGSRYGLEIGELGLHMLGFVWSPPAPGALGRQTPLGRVGYLWGKP
jgi:hypothetical protein